VFNYSDEYREAEKKGLIIQKGHQKSSIEEGQTTQWPNEKGQRTFYKTNTQN
jgi:hypothetical protein